jgi:peptidoglycan/xylan/chitin deacetylase (PgdA/CDA1 family)
VITRLTGSEKVVAFTFDACPTSKPQHFDASVLDFIVGEKLPATLFISERFARSTADEIKRLSALDFIEIENHSVSHNNHMERLPDGDALQQMDDSFLAGLTGRKTKFFRFPAGNCDERTLALAERCFRVVHWSFPSGDFDTAMTPQELSRDVLTRVRPGSILIFHINGNGHSTGKALPGIVAALKSKGYRFVKIEDALNSLPSQNGWQGTCATDRARHR